MKNIINIVKEAEAVTEQKAELDLCSTCVYEVSCSFRKSHPGNIFYCEEFDTGLPELRLSLGENNGSPKEIKQYSGLKGLCMNCIHSDTCTLTKPETGVWHCNEYE